MIINLDRNQINVSSTTKNLFKDSKGSPLMLEEMVILDIETVSGEECFSILQEKSPSLANIFLKKFQNEEVEIDDLYIQKSPLMPEFGKIVCVSINYMSPMLDKHSNSFYFENKSISFASDNEKNLLIDVVVTLNGILRKFEKYRTNFRKKNDKYPEVWLVGHNILNFDIPFFKNRCLIHGILPPELLYEESKKPWDIKVKDTLNIWRSSYGYSGLATLKVICEVMGVKTPKDLMSGKDVGNVFYSKNNSIEENLKQIATYCEKDVKACRDLLIKMQNLTSYTYG